MAAASFPCASLPQDIYGGGSLSGIYTSGESDFDDEEIDSSAVNGRAYAGAEFDPDGHTTRIEAASSYYAYFDRRDRWSNSLEAEQSFRLSDKLSLELEAAGATNVSTLEARSADQLSAIGRLRYESGSHRLILAAAARQRSYDDVDADASAPYAGIDYRYRFGRYQYLDIDARQEWVDSSLDSRDYDRLWLAAYYTHPLGGDTRLRAGLAHRRWDWDSRLTASGAPLRDRLLVPQVRLTTPLIEDIDLELDYRRVLRRSNDDRFDRDANRLSATLRASF